MIGRTHDRHDRALVRPHLAVLLDDVVPAVVIENDSPASRIGDLGDDAHGGRSIAAIGRRAPNCFVSRTVSPTQQN
jgi:hypothetical protein